MTAEEYQAYLDELNANPWLTQVVNGTLEITGYRGKMPDIVIPAKINGVAVASIKNNAFTDNNILRRVTIAEGIRSIGYNAFRRCGNLEEVILPDSVTEIGDYAFVGCTKLEKITLPKENVTLGEGMFEDCEALEELVLPEGLTVVEDYSLPADLTCIEANAFEGDAMTIVDASGCTAIGENAFRNCTGLSQIRLPQNCAISGTAFSGCTALLAVYAQAGGTTEVWCAQAKIPFVGE